MEQNSDLNLRIPGQGSTTPFARNNVSSMFPQTPSSTLHGIKRGNSQSSAANFGPSSRRSNKADESRLTDLEDLLRQMDQMRKECEKKDTQLEIYSEYIKVLKSNCAGKATPINHWESEANLKDRRSSTFSQQSNSSTVNDLQERCNSKDVQLVELKNKIRQLEAEIAKKDTQLKEACCNSEKQLSEKEHLIGKLQAESVEMKKQLEKKTIIISNLQTHCNDKDAQLAEKENLIKRLQTKRVKKEFDVEIIPEKLENLEDKVNSHFDTLFDRAEECLKQKQYVKAANVHYKEAIKFEQATQERSDKLALLFVNQSFCYGELKSFQQEIDTASSALQHDPNCKEALHNRAYAYFKLKQYLNARQDLEEALRLDPNFEFAHTLLADVQKCIDQTT